MLNRAHQERVRGLVPVEEREPCEIALALSLDADLHDRVLVEDAIALAIKLVQIVRDWLAAVASCYDCE